MSFFEQLFSFSTVIRLIRDIPIDVAAFCFPMKITVVLVTIGCVQVGIVQRFKSTLVVVPNPMNGRKAVVYCTDMFVRKKKI